MEKEGIFSPPFNGRPIARNVPVRGHDEAIKLVGTFSGIDSFISMQILTHRAAAGNDPSQVVVQPRWIGRNAATAEPLTASKYHPLA